MNADPARAAEALIEEVFGVSLSLQDLEEIVASRSQDKIAALVRSASAPPEDLVEEIRGPASDMEKIEATMHYVATYRIDRLIPTVRGGRRREQTAFVWVVFHLLVGFVFHSAHGTAKQIGHRWVWRRMRAIAKDLFPDEPEMWLPSLPMARHHYLYFKKRYLKDPVVLAHLKTCERELAAQLAQDCGIFDPRKPKKWSNLNPEDFFQGDGTVIAPRYRAKPGTTVTDRTTGEIREKRSDPDATMHVEGGGNAAYGNKFVFLSARTPYGRVFLDHELVPLRGEGGEAGVAMRCLERLVPLLPGAVGLNYDRAMRGMHIDQAARELGLVIATGMVKDDDVTGEPKAWHIEDREVLLPSGAWETIRVYAQRGAPGLLERDERGDEHFIELELDKREVRVSPGSIRMYRVVLLPDRLGGSTLRIRVTGDDEDDARGLNRAEHLRFVAETDADFYPLKAQRNDAESLNRYFTDTLDFGRAHSVGALAQDADVLGFALGQNALTWWRLQRAAKARGAPAA